LANHKSALKRAKQSEQRRMRNRSRKSQMKTSIRTLQEAITEKSEEQIAAGLKQAIGTIDRTASRGVIHKNKAARMVSRLTRKVNRLTAEEQA